MSNLRNMPESEKDFLPDPTMDAAINAKIKAAGERGVDLEAYLDMPAGDAALKVADGFGLSTEEKMYLAKREIYRQVQIYLGQKIIETLNENNCRIDRADLIPCLTAYYEAVDEGEIDAV